MKNTMAIAVMECSRACNRLDSPEEIIKASMKCAHSHWLVTDENERFAASLEGAARVLQEKNPEAFEKMVLSVEAMKALNEVLAGNLSGIERFAELEPGSVFPLQAMWQEAA